MKGLLLVAGFVGGGVALLLGVLWFGARNAVDEHVEMTRAAADVVVTDSTSEDNYEFSQHRGYQITYRYLTDGRWFSGEEWVPEETWEPGRNVRLLVCVNPDEPAEHVVARRIGAECGQGDVGSADIQRGEKTTAPQS